MTGDLESQYMFQCSNFSTMAICPNQDVGITQKPISLHMKEGNMHRETSL